MKKLLCEAIVFDLDGVLVDSTLSIIKTWENWAIRHNVDIKKILNIMYGRPPGETMRLVAPHLDIETEAAKFIIAEINDVAGLVPVKGAKSLVKSLPVTTWGIATSGIQDLAVARLQAVGLPIPPVLVTADTVKRGKPDPESYLLAAKQIRVPSEKCIAIEDAPAGITAARSAGMKVIGITTTHPPEALKGTDAIAVNLSAIKSTIYSHSEQCDEDSAKRYQIELIVD